MTESISQGIPKIKIIDDIYLAKLNDISFSALKRDGIVCNSSTKKPDQLVIKDNKVLIAIEDKNSAENLDHAIDDLEKKYLPNLPDTYYFIARAGDRTKVFFRTSKNKISEIGTSLKGKEVLCFGPKVISGENKEVLKNLKLLSTQIILDKKPINGSLEIKPPDDYYNPLTVKEETIYNLWQKIFVATGENAHKCLETFVELLLYKGISDANLLPSDYSIKSLKNNERPTSLRNYKSTIRKFISENLFPTLPNQPGVINGFAFDEEESVFKNVLSALDELGNLAQKQIDPDFKRRIIEAFLGSGNREGTIKSGKHLTPRNIIQMIWEISGVEEGKTIVDPACGVGGFVLEGLNYPYEFNPLNYKAIGIDRADEMIIVSKANMVLHLLDKFYNTNDNDRVKLAKKINQTFLHAKNNGTGTLGELESHVENNSEFRTKITADFVFANVPFYTNGVSQIDASLADLGFANFYDNSGLGVESRFLKYIVGLVNKGDPGLAFVIVTDGILRRHLDKARSMLNFYTDILGIISLPEGIFQNNNWKTSILIFKKKTKQELKDPVFLYVIDQIGISLDTYRSPIKENDIPNLKIAWQKRNHGPLQDPKSKLISREDFLKTKRWSELFEYYKKNDDDLGVTFGEFIDESTDIASDILKLIKDSDKKINNIFSLENFEQIELGNSDYFETNQAPNYKTVRFARRNQGPYPLFSSQVTGPVASMEDPNDPPIFASKSNKIISWNIKGNPAEDIRVHDTKFYCTENRGLIRIKNKKISFDYILFFLKEHLVKLGGFLREDEAHAGKVKSIKVNLPTDKKGEIDLEKQNQICQSYKVVNEIKQELKKKIRNLDDSISKIDLFK